MQLLYWKYNSIMAKWLHCLIYDYIIFFQAVSSILSQYIFLFLINNNK